MSKKLSNLLVAILSLMLSLAIAICTTGCNKTGDKNPASTSKVDKTTSTQSETEDTKDDGEDFDDDDIGDIDDDGYDYDDDWDDSLIGGPEFDDQYEDEYEDLEDFDEFDEYDEEFEFDISNYTNPIQLYGSAVSGNNRTVKINVDKVVHKDFLGFGDHLFCSGLDTEIMEKIGYNEVSFEFDIARTNLVGTNLARTWFQVDWIVTNTESNPKRTDVKNNKDYQNYLNGIYDFESSTMKSVYKYFDRYEEMGIDIFFCFGWKQHERIQNWFNQPCKIPDASAPYDANAFAKATVATLKNFWDRGYTNVPYLTLYNEPANGGDFMTVGDGATYWAVVAHLIDKELKAQGLRDKIEFFGCEINDLWRNHHTFMDKFVLAEQKYDALDYYSCHHYYKAPHGDNNYETMVEDMLYFTNVYKKRMMVTEMSASDEDCTESQDQYYYHKDWNDTYSSYILGAANVGVKGVLAWCLSTGYTGFVGPNKTAGWQGEKVFSPTRILDGGVVNMKAPTKEFFETSLLCNYIDSHSDVLMVDWTGDDIRAAVFKNKDGEYTILVDTKGGDQPLDVTFALSKAVNKTFYRFQYDRDETPTLNSGIPTCQKEISVARSFTDTLEAKEAMYIYTTKKPRKQVALNEPYVKVAPGGTFDFDEILRDCESGDKVEWSIVAATNKEGSVNANGVYTADASAKKGDYIAVRAQLKSDKLAYAVAFVEIK